PLFFLMLRPPPVCSPLDTLFLTLNVKNQAFVPEIEGFLNFQLLSSFICKSQNDFEKFMHLCKEKQRLAINACELKSHVPASGMSSSEVRALGFDGFLIDFVSGRPEVMDFLRVFGNFASIPVAKNHVDDDMVFKKTGFRRIAIQGRYYEIKRSRYSQGNSNDYVIIQNPLPKVNLFTNFISNEQLKEIDEEFALKDAIRRDNQATYKKILEEVEVVSMQLDRATARRN
ncbi:Structural maintenance of chromosomes protein 5, partial [Dictyocoela roeselum]